MLADLPPAVITYDPGGRVIEAIALANAFKSSGRLVIVKGDCYSACTVLVTTPGVNSCIARSGRLHFHRADVGDLTYPQPVWNEIYKRGGLPSFVSGKFLMMDYWTVRKFMRTCTVQELGKIETP